MGATTNLRVTAAVMLVYVGLIALSGFGGLLDRWSAGVGQAIRSTALVLFVPAEVAAVVWALRRTPRWPCLEPDRLSPLLDPDERPLAVAAVRIAGTQPWRPALLFYVVGFGGLLGLIALGDARVMALVFLPFALLLIPFAMLGVGIANGWADRSARRGSRHSTARRVPPSRGRQPDWLVLTDRRVAIVGTVRGGRAELVWHVPRGELEGAEPARRSWRTLDRTIRLHFTDGSSVRLTAPDAPAFLAASP